MRRALPLLVLLLAALAACGRDEDARAPFTDSRIPPGLEHRFYPPRGWAWGLVRVGKAPPLRYGVGAPAATPKAQVLILPGYGEPAEAWFETARELIAGGCTVWILEGSGQGGSGRYAAPRDLVHAPSLDPDVAALVGFASGVARERPLFLLASAQSAPLAVRAAALGLKVDRLILSDPVLRPEGDVAKARKMRRFGLGRLRAEGGGWRRAGTPVAAPGADRVRAGLPRAWQAANPDLRMGGPSWAWRAAFADEAEAALAAEPRVRVPVLVLRAGDPAQRACGRIPVCTEVTLAGPGAGLRDGDDGAHQSWLAALWKAIFPDSDALASQPAPATLDDQS